MTNAVETLPDVTPAFLDNCLQTYFTRFNPTFPVLHRPTFVFRECSPSLLLNAIALGSLFIGTEEAVSKGEALWRLAYTAVSTSWQSLMSHQGIYDSRSGVQLVLTALLGQTYAMLSRNESLRVTSQIYQSLSFSWARHSDLFDFDSLDPLTLPDPSNKEELLRSWKVWVSRELQLRALLGHYILDGQLSFLSDQPTSVMHTTNSLLLSSSPRLFDSQSADEWYSEMRAAPQTQTSFRQIYAALFESPALDPALGGSDQVWSLNTDMDVRVVLECIHTLVRETQHQTYRQSIWQPPSPTDISSALLQVRNRLYTGWPHHTTERLGLLMRWHFVALDTVATTMSITRQLCRRYQVGQRLIRVDGVQEFHSLEEWSSSTDAKRALLHAVAIQEITAQLPPSHLNSMWMLLPVFAAATICAAFCLDGVSTITLPPMVDWNTVLGVGMDGYEDQGKSDTQQFLASDVRQPLAGQARNLRYDLDSLQAIIHGLSVHWGVCAELEHILQTLKAHCP